MTLVILGVLLILGGRAYEFFWHPEWTEAVAFLRLWWLWLLAVLMVGLGDAWMVLTAGSKNR